MDIKLRGAELALDEAIINLLRITGTCNASFEMGDDRGVTLAKKVRSYREEINEALKYWNEALINYNNIKGFIEDMEGK